MQDYTVYCVNPYFNIRFIIIFTFLVDKEKSTKKAE